MECKKQLAKVLIDYLAPIHKKRKEFEKSPQKLQKILAQGSEKARKIATKTLIEAKQAVGII